MKKFKWVVMNILGSPLALIQIIISILDVLIAYAFKALYWVFGFKDKFDIAADFNTEQRCDFYDDLKFR